MCKAASFVSTKDKVFWSKTSDSHEDIIREFKLHPDGVRGPNIMRTEISPPGDNLSLPSDQWVFKTDQNEFPVWFDLDVEEKRCRLALRDWAECKLTGWNVKEAFNPINPFKIKRRKISDKELESLIRQWASVRDSVRASVRASVWASVGASVRNSVGNSVWNSVGNSVWDSVWAYTGGLFPNIKEWKYAEKLGSDPWRPLLTLWYAGYIPVYDGKKWMLLAGEKTEIVFECVL